MRYCYTTHECWLVSTFCCMKVQYMHTIITKSVAEVQSVASSGRSPCSNLGTPELVVALESESRHPRRDCTAQNAHNNDFLPAAITMS